MAIHAIHFASDRARLRPFDRVSFASGRDGWNRLGIGRRARVLDVAAHMCLVDLAGDLQH